MPESTLSVGRTELLRYLGRELGYSRDTVDWDDRQRKSAGNYDRAYENAAAEAERLLARAGGEIAPKLLDFYAVAVWEDQDECLEVRPEDVQL